MATPFQITVDDAEVRQALARLAGKLTHPAPLMQDIGRALGNITEDAFQDERSPTGVPWEPLTPEYVLRPRKPKTPKGWPGRGGDAHPILQRDGLLAGGITHGGDDRSAWVGASRIYAAIHQFGGRPGMAPALAAIPARPFIPVSATGDLAARARSEVLDLVRRHLEGS